MLLYETTVKPFQPIVAFYIETSHLFCSSKQMTGFYMKCNNRLKWAKKGKSTTRPNGQAYVLHVQLTLHSESYIILGTEIYI